MASISWAAKQPVALHWEAVAGGQIQGLGSIYQDFFQVIIITLAFMRHKTRPQRQRREADAPAGALERLSPDEARWGLARDVGSGGRDGVPAHKRECEDSVECASPFVRLCSPEAAS